MLNIVDSTDITSRKLLEPWVIKCLSMNMNYNRPIKWIEWVDTYSKKMSLYYRGWNNFTVKNISKVLLIRYLDNVQWTILLRF